MGVLGDIQNVQCWGRPELGLRNTDLNKHIFLAVPIKQRTNTHGHFATHTDFG